jgi:hypothetical protein
VAVGCVLFCAAMAACDQGARDGCDATAAGEDLFEDYHADAQAGAQRLRLRDVTEIVVGEFMGQHTPKMLVAGFLKETGRDMELSTAAAGRIDVGMLHDPNLDLIQGPRMVYGGDERGHDVADALSLLRIERMRRGLAPARPCQMGLAWRRASYSGAPRSQEEDEDGGAAVRAHQCLRPEHERRDHERDAHRKRTRHRFAHCRSPDSVTCHHAGRFLGRVNIGPTSKPARLPLARVAARVHAGRVGIAVGLVVLPVLVQAIERPAAGADEATDDRALAGAAPAIMPVPPAAPTAAPATVLIAPAMTVSLVFSRWPARAAADWLHVSIADCVGTPAAVGAAGKVARGGAARPGLTSTTFLSLSLPLQFATMRPVTSTLAITRAIPMAVSFHGFFQLSFVMLSILRGLR